MSKTMRKIMTFFLLTALALASLTGCGGKTGYKKEKNTDKHAVTYPYVVHTKSADLYLAAADIELLGEEEFDKGMNQFLENLEADLEDARNVLKPYLTGDVPKISIYTDFSGRTENGKRPEIGGYYSDDSVDIHIFHSWEQASVVLLHEYTHYLSIHCCNFNFQSDFWREAMADYVSKIRCVNRMCVDVNYEMSEAEFNEIISRGAGTKEGKLDLRLLYYGTAVMFRTEAAIGIPYLAVSQAATTLTQSQWESPLMNEMSYYEAACFMDYLVEKFGEEKVFANMNIGAKQFSDVYGKTYQEICTDWTADLKQKCRNLGLRLDFLD